MAAATKPQDLAEWSLVGLTEEQGLARWSAVCAGSPPTSRMTVPTNWGWLTWEATDSEAAHTARLAGRTPTPVMTEIAVNDPDSPGRRRSPQPAADPITTNAWSALTGLVLGGFTGLWYWGAQVPSLLLAMAGAAGTAGTTMLWRRWITARRGPVRVLTEYDSEAASVVEGAKILTWVTDYLRIHANATAEEQRPATDTLSDQAPEFADAGFELHRGLWALATGRAFDARATLTEMIHYADLVLQLIEAHERVRRASAVRIAGPAPAPRATDPAAERLRDAARRLNDAISGQRHAADVIGDINSRLHETG